MNKQIVAQAIAAAERHAAASIERIERDWLEELRSVPARQLTAIYFEWSGRALLKGNTEEAWQHAYLAELLQAYAESADVCKATAH